MYEVLTHATLATGDEIEIGAVTPPDKRWGEHILPLLGHKELYFVWQMERAFESALDGLRMRFYIGSLDGQVITNVLVSGAAGAGIVGHVYTLPAYRGRGAARAVMTAQMADMARQGIHVLTLSAEPGHAYRMYETFGFRGLQPGTGLMRWEDAPGVAAALVGRSLGAVRPARWADWGVMNLLPTLALGADEEVPRSPTLGINGLGEVEQSFPDLHYRAQLEPPHPPFAWLVLGAAESPEVALGWAVVAPHDRWFYDAATLDLFVRPGYGDLDEGYRRLLAALPAEARRLSCTTAGDGPRAAALRDAGFNVAATLPAWLEADGARRDVRVFVRP